MAATRTADDKLIAQMLAALRSLIPLIDMAFDHEGDVFRAKHNDAVDACAAARAAIAKAEARK